MSLTPVDLFTHAQSLPEGSEAEIRTKISRLYYALYSHACDFSKGLKSDGLTLKKDAGSHKRLSQMLTNPTVEDTDLQGVSRQMGTKQQLAHDIRVKADYHLDEVVVRADLRKCARYVADGLAIPVPTK